MNPQDVKRHKRLIYELTALRQRVDMLRSVGVKVKQSERVALVQTVNALKAQLAQHEAERKGTQ